MRYFTEIDGVEREYRFERKAGKLLVHVDGQTLSCDLQMIGDGSAFSLVVDGRSYDCLVEREGRRAAVQLLGERIRVGVQDERERTASAVAGAKPAGPREVEAAMPGVVVEILVDEGDAVADGQTLVILEAMKMQNPIKADGAGKVTRVAVRRGDAVAGGAVLVELGE